MLLMALRLERSWSLTLILGQHRIMVPQKSLPNLMAGSISWHTEQMEQSYMRRMGQPMGQFRSQIFILGWSLVFHEALRNLMADCISRRQMRCMVGNSG